MGTLVAIHRVRAGAKAKAIKQHTFNLKYN